MAYSRWFNSDWYIFWVNKEPGKKLEEELAVWHCTCLDSSFSQYTYKQIKEMLEKDDFSEIPGYEEKYHDFLKEIFEDWIDDVDLEYASKRRKRGGY